MAAKTWEGDWWKYGGGGTAWDAMAFDPELNLLYIGTGNGSPWDWFHRSNGKGDNLFLSSIVALNADNGEMVWYYQTTPGDHWDYTATQHLLLADLNRRRKRNQSDHAGTEEWILLCTGQKRRQIIVGQTLYIYELGHFSGYGVWPPVETDL